MASFSPLKQSSPIRKSIYRITGNDKNGYVAYYFLLADRLKEPLLLHDVKCGKALSLPYYGEVIASGYGAHVPASTQKRIESLCVQPYQKWEKQ